jgi:hypothetical protein
MEINMKGNGLMIRKMEKVVTRILQLEKNMMDNGLMERNMVLGLILIVMVINTLENGRMEKNSNIFI